MKYVFWGTPQFAEIVLARLFDAEMPPVALVCNPDRPVGRKKLMTPPPTKQLVSGKKTSIKIFQPEQLDESFTHELRAIDTDLDFFVVAAYAKIIPKNMLAIARLGTLGVHPSLLPKYRGSSPIQSAILAGEATTGATIYLMDEKMDHGPILAQKSCDAGNGMVAYEDLEGNLAELSAELLIKTMAEFENGHLKPRTQDESKATFTKKFATEDGFISEAELSAAEHGDAKAAELIIRKINALNPEPGAWTRKNGKRIKLLAGTITQGALKLSKIQQEGEKPRVV